MAAMMRRVRLFLREFRRVDARVGLPQGQPLTTFLSTRRSYLNLIEAVWSGDEQSSPHAVVKVEHVLWASSPDGDIPLVGASSPTVARGVEIYVDGGFVLRGALAMGAGQRLSDYLETQGGFVPLQAAALLRTGPPPRGVNLVLGDIALNQDAIHAVREVETVPNGALPAVATG